MDICCARRNLPVRLTPRRPMIEIGINALFWDGEPAKAALKSPLHLISSDKLFD